LNKSKKWSLSIQEEPVLYIINHIFREHFHFVDKILKVNIQGNKANPDTKTIFLKKFIDCIFSAFNLP